MDIKQAIQRARMDKKLSQKELSAKLCVPANVIHHYENGTVLPTNAFIARIESVLQTKLPRVKKTKKLD